MLWGYFKKMVIADTLLILVNNIFDGRKYVGAYILVGTIATTLHLYTSFSGGVDIARGAAEVLGMTMPQNFQRPYFAQSLAEYWRRWHISLNDWWRDYVFYPITLSKPMLRVGKFCRKVFGNPFGKMVGVYIGIFIVRFVNAVWHGARPVFLLTGVYYGVIMTLGMMLEPAFRKLEKALHINTEAFSWRLFQILRTFALICVAGLMITLPNVQDFFWAMKEMVLKFNIGVLFDGALLHPGLNQKEWHMLTVALLVLFAVSLLQERGVKIRQTLARQNYVFQWLVTAALVLAILIFGAYGEGYNAADFIYQQF
jgi:D-alanyl-lipoteichoic acid acyltransferase DltB (MBOAT superfamily)